MPYRGHSYICAKYLLLGVLSNSFAWIVFDSQHSSAASSHRLPLEKRVLTSSNIHTLQVNRRECSGHNDEIHQILDMENSRTRPCSQVQGSQEYAACRTTGRIECQNSTGTGVVVEIDPNIDPNFVVTAAHVIFEQDGNPRRACYFYPYQFSRVRARIDARRLGMRTTRSGAPDFTSGDIAVARIGQTEVLGRNGSWGPDSSPIYEYTGTLSIPSENELATYTAGDRNDLRLIGYNTRTRDMSVSVNCRVYVHDPELDRAAPASFFLKHDCSARSGRSGGPIVATPSGRSAQLVCIHDGEFPRPTDRPVRFNRAERFNTCSPITAEFRRILRTFANGSN